MGSDAVKGGLKIRLNFEDKSFLLQKKKRKLHKLQHSFSDIPTNI